MSGRINQLIIRVIVSQIRESHPTLLQDDADALLCTEFTDGFPLEPYRTYLQNVLRHCGGEAILSAGRRLEGTSDPLLFVLLNSDSVSLLIEKEARLGRFIHSRHVVRVIVEKPNGVVLEHVSNELEDPLPEENLASAGLHISLLEQLGCHGLRLRFPFSESSERWIYENGEYKPGIGNAGFHRWHFEWDAFTPTRKPLAGLDALLLSGDTGPELAEAPAEVLAILRVVQGDMARTWTLNHVAKRLAVSPRSLQRSLAQADTSFSKVITEWRLAEARRLLMSTELSITDIGYICGFSDTSHFSRRFKAYYGESPSAYHRRIQ